MDDVLCETPDGVIHFANFAIVRGHTLCGRPVAREGEITLNEKNAVDINRERVRTEGVGEINCMGCIAHHRCP